ncbi:hypothetical protein DFH06DRAFT_1208373 [Mycena polygramma]|nr:hypothetical protein DFH06DRAFT_1208373 [Mycena polygramma]
MSLSAVKLLWRRLDNLVPLLRLLPSFTEANEIYGLFGTLNTPDSHPFDQHAAYVQEIVYDRVPDTIQIDPSAYLRLSLHNPPVLPNLRRLRCSGIVPPSAAEILLLIQSPLRVLDLQIHEPMNPVSAFVNNFDIGPKVVMARDLFVSCLAAKPSRISSLILHRQPFRLLSEGIPLLNLTSLELKFMKGGMDRTLLHRIGHLPHLTSFAAGAGCFASLNLGEIAADSFETAPPHLEQKAHGSLFTQLTHLELLGGLSMEGSSPSFRTILEIMGTKKLHSLTLKHGMPGLGRRKGWGSSAMTKEHEDPLPVIASRWSTSLRQLALVINHAHTSFTDFLSRLSGLSSLSLLGFLRVPDTVDISFAFAGLRDLQNLSLHCQWFSTGNIPIQLDIRSITRIAELCPELHTLSVVISLTNEVPPLSSIPMISHNLGTLTVRQSGRIADAVVLARYLDRLFPRLNAVRYTAWDGTNSENAAGWKQVQKLIFAFQDVRRDALRGHV